MNIFFLGQIDRATVLYDQPPEFFHPTSLEEKHEVNYMFQSKDLIQNNWSEKTFINCGLLLVVL